MSELQSGIAPDAAAMRTAMGHFLTGVTVITATADGEPVGLAANSFTSVSLDPPLVLFCAARSSGTWPKIDAAGRFCVNVLPEDGEQTCRIFASPGDRFSQVGWHVGVTGSPVLDEALAYADCEIEHRYDGGDHVIVVGRVVDLGHRTHGTPLAFYRGGYGRFES
jgi:3-hydroxy-9,10-secoandrosta-1,3,5(10)-triene-9,17-dione monooxygenase reductase component